jgi:hypothetical protein
LITSETAPSAPSFQSEKAAAGCFGEDKPSFCQRGYYIIKKRKVKPCFNFRIFLESGLTAAACLPAAAPRPHILQKAENKPVYGLENVPVLI